VVPTVTHAVVVAADGCQGTATVPLAHGAAVVRVVVPTGACVVTVTGDGRSGRDAVVDEHAATDSATATPVATVRTGRQSAIPTS
jgi:hypothetical protein